MKLLYSSVSPFARKAHATVRELKLTDRIELAEITQPTIPTRRLPEISRENPLGKVPVLICDDGRRIFDSAVIAEYLDDLGQGGLFPRSEQRWTALTLHALADGVMEAGVACRLEGLRPEAIRWPEWVQAHQGKIVAALDAVEAQPGFLEGPFNIGHLALVCAIEWLDFRKIYEGARRGRPILARWHDKVRERPSLLATRPR